MKKIIVIFLSIFICLPVYAVEYTADTYDDAIKYIDDSINNNINDYITITFDSNVVNSKELYKYFKTTYQVDKDKYMYKYDEYGLREPLKNDMYFDTDHVSFTNYAKITSEESQMLDQYTNRIVDKIKDKSDYDKILFTYLYLSNGSKYDYNVYENVIEASASAFDVFVKKSSVCNSNSVAFQYMMEKLGIESYIVDVFSDEKKDKGEIKDVVHTYNVVKLDDEWYIIDIKYNSDLSGFLKGNGERLDGIRISKTDYDLTDKNTSIEINYEDYEMDEDEYILIPSKKVDINKIDKDEKSISDLMCLAVIVSIISVITIIVVLATRKK